MEFHPEGSVHLTLEEHGEEHKWNKVTSCIQNLLGEFEGLLVLQQ